MNTRLLTTVATTAAALASLVLLAGPPALAQAMLQDTFAECNRFGRRPDSFGGCWVPTRDGGAVRLKETFLGVEAEPIPNQFAPRRYRDPLDPPGY